MMDEKPLWKTLKNVRESFLQQTSRYYCLYGRQSLLSLEYIRNNTNKLGVKLGIKSTNIPLRTIYKETLLEAASMFTYLNYCPSKQIETYNFFKYLITEGSSKDIILALTSIIKTSHNAAKKGIVGIFLKAMESWQLKQYEQIQIITKGKCDTITTSGNCTDKMNVRNIELLGLLLQKTHYFIAYF